MTRRIEAVSTENMEGIQFNLIDTIGLLDSKLSNSEVLNLATEAVKKGFKTVNRFVIVLRQGRLNPREI